MIYSEGNNPRNILIIEEHLIVSLELQRQLEKHNYNVQRASIFTPTLRIKNKPDIIIADTSTKGNAYFQKIKNTWPGHEIPVICTSIDCAETLMNEKELKVIAKFLKPLNTQEILNTVNNHFILNH